MEPEKMAQQMVYFQKTLFESSFNAMNMVLDQSEQMTRNFVKQVPWVPEEGRKTLEETFGFYKKAREDFKRAVDDSFSKMETIFTAK